MAAHLHHDHVIGRIKAMLVQGVHVRPGGMCACRLDCRQGAACPESRVGGEAGLRQLHKVRLTDCGLQELRLVVLKDDLQQAGGSLRARGSRQLTQVEERFQSCNTNCISAECA